MCFPASQSYYVYGLICRTNLYTFLLLDKVLVEKHLTISWIYNKAQMKKEEEEDHNKHRNEIINVWER